jgi:purine nucleosidase
MLDFYDRWDVAKYGTLGGPLHDPTVIAYLLQPQLFTGRHVSVEIDTRPGLTEGMTVVDWWGVTSKPANATVMNQIDADGFYDLLVERIGRL